MSLHLGGAQAGSGQGPSSRYSCPSPAPLPGESVLAVPGQSLQPSAWSRVSLLPRLGYRQPEKPPPSQGSHLRYCSLSSSSRAQPPCDELVRLTAGVVGNSQREAPLSKFTSYNCSVNDFWKPGSCQMGPGRDFYLLLVLPRQGASAGGEMPILLLCSLHRGEQKKEHRLLLTSIKQVWSAEPSYPWDPLRDFLQHCDPWQSSRFPFAVSPCLWLGCPSPRCW